MATAKVVMSVQDADTLKESIQRVQEELTRVRDKAQQEVVDLDRIRGMIDLKYLNELLAAVERLEARVKTVERDSGAAAVRKELSKEQERLAKLWDAFKNQEDELRSAVKERDQLSSRFGELEKAYKSMGSVTQARSKLSYFEKENRHLADELQKTAESSEEYRRKFDQERQRLAKLFKVYEDSASSLADHKREIAAWRAWLEKQKAKLPAAARNAAGRIRKAK